MVTAIRSLPEHVSVRDCQVLACIDCVGRPEDDFAVFGETLREVWSARVLEKGGTMVDAHTGGVRERQLVAIYARNAVHSDYFLLRPLVSFEESTK
jgi:hypothetical protein